jgi:YebC/PmpR family DNA-binding regulatory protein
MSGHSKWATIKHKKAKEDAKRGKIFTKIIKEISIAARMGGGDSASNPRLRSAVQAARAANMPLANIEKAIKKGTGELPGVAYEDHSYEGYGPGGAAVIVEVLTDNKNRITGEVRHIFSKYNGNMGESGCVSWMFEKKGFIAVDGEKTNEDAVMEVALDAGADDINSEGKNIEVTSGPENFEKVKKALENAGLQIVVSEVTMLPKNTVKLTGKDASTMLKLMEALEDNDDVQNVYSNFDISEEEMAQMG